MIRRGGIYAYLLLGVTVAAAGQTRDQNWDKCKADDPDTSIAGCTALIQSGQESPADLATAYFDRGIAHRDKKEYDLALQDLDQALKLKPEFSGALNTRGNVYADMGETDRAIADYNDAIRLDPNYALAYYNRGNAYGDKKEWDKANADYDQYVKLAPADPDGFNNRGHAYMMKGDFDRALEDFRAALKIDPNHPLATYNTGVTESDKNEYAQAVTAFTRYIALKPDDPDGYESRGNAYRHQGQYDEAIAEYNHALQVKPDYSLAYYYRGLTQGLEGEYDAAIADLNKYVDMEPKDSDGFAVRGLEYFEKGQYAPSIADFDKALELQPNRAYAFLERGSAHYLAGQTSQAAADFELAIGADPSTSTAVYAALWLHLTKARLHQAGNEELQRVAQKANLSIWPGPVLKFYLGQSTEVDLMAAAADPDPQTHVGRACEVNFYEGEDALAHQKRTTAVARFHAVQGSCIKDYIEYGGALAELKQMAAPAAPAKTSTPPAKKTPAPAIAAKGGIKTEERDKASGAATPETPARASNTPPKAAVPSRPEMGGTQLEDRAEELGAAAR
jgi:lipoprotein NlpI